MRGRSGICVVGEIFWWQLNKVTVLYLYCNSFFVRDVHGEFGLISVHFLTCFLQFCLEKSGISFRLESGNPARAVPPQECLPNTIRGHCRRSCCAVLMCKTSLHLASDVARHGEGGSIGSRS